MTVLDWLLDSDPAIRWQTLRDLTDEAPAVVEAERARVADVGWGAKLLALQGPDGQWAGGAHFPVPRSEEPGQPWTATSFSLKQLWEFGVDPRDPRVRRAVALVRENSRWEHAGQRFFDGEVEPCINGMTLAFASYFGEDVTGIADRLLADELDDGGWNCEMENGSTRSSFNSTIAVLEGLWEFERATGGSPEVTAARERGQEYLLERHLLRRLSTGEIPVDDWTRFSYPPRWHYDALRALDYLRSAAVPPDYRIDEAIDLVTSKRDPEGRWPVENTHRGAVHFAVDAADGEPSRWNTLRALRVLDWAGV